MAGVGPSKVGDQVRFSSEQLHGHPRQTPPSRQLLKSRSGDDLRSNSGRIALTAVKAIGEHCEDDRAEADQRRVRCRISDKRPVYHSPHRGTSGKNNSRRQKASPPARDRDENVVVVRTHARKLKEMPSQVTPNHSPLENRPKM